MWSKQKPLRNSARDTFEKSHAWGNVDSLACLTETTRKSAFVDVSQIVKHFFHFVRNANTAFPHVRHEWRHVVAFPRTQVVPVIAARVRRSISQLSVKIQSISHRTVNSLCLDFNYQWKRPSLLSEQFLQGQPGQTAATESRILS